MALTPEDVSNKRFTTVRLREGYDMTEVDQFLDEVEAELRRIGEENSDLRARLEAAVPVNGGGPATASSDAVPETAAETEPAPEVEPEPERAPETASETRAQTGPQTEAESVAAPAAKVPEQPTLRVTTTKEASAAATRLLELAGHNADELVAEAKQEAERLVAEAKDRAQVMENETSERRRSLLAGIEQQKADLEAEVEKLRIFEGEYRAELRAYFEEQLAALDGQGPSSALPRTRQPEAAEPASS